VVRDCRFAAVLAEARILTARIFAVIVALAFWRSDADRLPEMGRPAHHQTAKPSVVNSLCCFAISLDRPHFQRV
jgi:hypothetical protein